MENQLSDEIRNDPILFADQMLGIMPHPGQQKWIKNANKLINILRPGNRFGKSLSEALLHIWHAVCKPGLRGRVHSEEEWLRVDYPTLIFGPEYEQSRELLRLMVEIVEGNLLVSVCPFCDTHRIHKETARDKEFTCMECKKAFKEPASRTNKSLLKGWAIQSDRSSAQLMPSLEWTTGSKTLARSYDEMGKAFKMKALAFITGDECADIMELYTFTSNTLLPRLINFKGVLHFVGTPQPGGLDYQRMIEMAEEDMERSNWDEKGKFYTQRGSVYENIYVDAEYIEQLESVADPDLKRQIIDGEFVEIGDKYFGFDRIKNMVDPDTRLIEEGLPGRKYLLSVDFAFGDSVWADYTVMMVFDYTEEPWRLVYFRRFKAKEIPVPLQYEKVREVCQKFAAKVIIDSSGPGGKNALAFLRDIYPIPFEAGPTGPQSSKKAEGLGSLKAALDGGNSELLRRKVRVMDDGSKKDLNPNWGLIRVPNIPELIGEMVNYRLDDKKLRTDCVMALMMAADYLMIRRPKTSRNRAVDLDFLSLSIDDRNFHSSSFPYSRRNKAYDY